MNKECLEDAGYGSIFEAEKSKLPYPDKNNFVLKFLVMP